MKRRHIDPKQGFFLFVPPGAHMVPMSAAGARDDFAQLVEHIAAQRRASGPFSEWLKLELDFANPEAREPAAALYRSYLAHAAARGVPPAQVMSVTAFGRALNRCGIKRAKDRRGRIVRLGCQLRACQPELAR